MAVAEKKAWLPVEYWDTENPDEQTNKSEGSLRKEQALMNGMLVSVQICGTVGCRLQIKEKLSLSSLEITAMIGSMLMTPSTTRKTKLRRREKHERCMSPVRYCLCPAPVFTLYHTGNLKRPKLFFRALEDAELWVAAKKTNRKNGRLASAVASRAASLAAAENKKPRLTSVYTTDITKSLCSLQMW